MSRYDFAALCLVHRDNLVGYCARLCGHDQAEDLVQDAFVSALRAWPAWDPKTDDPEAVAALARQWMYTNVRNKFFMFYRNTKRRRQKTEDQLQDVITAMSNTPDVDDQVCDEVSAALDELHPAARDVIERYHMKGEKYGEIAKALGLPMGTVMSRLHRARKQLAERLAPFALREYGFARREETEALRAAS